ncbi:MULTISPECIES: sialate O-acetylesterase [unclassified Lactobacillus]|uniref:sialate O-acetylesterase n=1 Tax=unclassified Lactobacillus TaxID=2620435 RepID=UPI00226A8149|nr:MULTISPECIES: sialate O-acetylesterase [unclassified Lactobacillus]MCX8721738.1 hypothetical protein [Lactobacillus sp. B4010]MCX8732474.1 hypothetical protein [Lactobacillus sp. B4015]MCX8734694.1 hypothetical protein [Lactobacillus sp. B4012]
MKLNQNILADVFQSNMILPLNKNLELGGHVKANEEVQVIFNKKVYRTKSNKLGDWRLRMPAVSNSKAKGSITAFSAQRKQTITNIKFGRVYLLSGQSNIEFRLRDELNFSEMKDKLQDGELKDLYYYNVPQVDYIDPKTHRLKPKNLQPEKWHQVNANNCGMMSAIGFYMMKSMRENGIKEPIAIIDCFKGGTSASVWIKVKTLEKDYELNQLYLVKYFNEIRGKSWEDFDLATKEYNLKVDKHNRELKLFLKNNSTISLSDAKNIVGHTPWPPPARPDLFTRPGGLYETMMIQIKNCVFNGMIWYQGENDVDRASQYHKLLPLLIKTWRKKLKDASLPVKIIQLPGYADYPENSGAIIRQVQELVSEKMTNVDLVSFIDGGEEHNIHPLNKKIMGERLGTIMAGNTYSGTPYIYKYNYDKNMLTLWALKCKKLKITKKVFFNLIIDGKPQTLEIMNNNLSENKIKIELKRKPEQISYAFENYTKNIGLYNEIGFPVSPFKFIL